MKKAEDVVSRGERVKVKVLMKSTSSGGKLTLSMRDVNQVTGADLMPRAADGSLARPADLAPRRKGKSSLGLSDEKIERLKELGKGRAKLQVGDYERWEIAQLRKTGLLAPEDDPNWDAERGYVGHQDEDSGEELEVELIDEEPAFLAGQTSRGGAEHEAVRIVADPDGSLSRAATTQGALARERRELRQQQQQELLDSIPKDLNRPWVDPMPESGERHLAAELRGIGTATSYEMPEWKAKGIGKAVSYGHVSTKSLKEQREGLPIYLFREQFLEAMSANQVLVVVGETGACFFLFFICSCFSV